MTTISALIWSLPLAILIGSGAAVTLSVTAIGHAVAGATLRRPVLVEASEILTWTSLVALGAGLIVAGLP